MRHGWGERFVAYSNDSKLLVSANLDGVFLWDPATGKEIGRIPHNDPSTSNCYALSPDGKIVAAGGAKTGRSRSDYSGSNEDFALARYLG